MNMTDLGWCDEFARSYVPYAQAGYGVGRVALASRDRYSLMTESNNMQATLSGKFRHQAIAPDAFPAVGDWVVIRSVPNGQCSLIEAVLPRKSQFVRRSAGSSTAAQVVAANIDSLFLVSGLDHDFNLRRIERYLVLAWQSGAQPVIILNKADVCRGLSAKVSAVEEIALGVPVIALSALEQLQIEDLSPFLQSGRTIALLGSSGVGKSTLTNQLLGSQKQLTQSVRADDSKGRHTTTRREMLRLPSGALLIDTPGMRELQLWDAEPESAHLLDATFADIETLAAECHFRDCQHDTQPGCAIQAALESGDLDAGRWRSYQKLQREEAYLHQRQSAQAQRNSKARWKKVSKSIRQRYRADGGA